MSACKIVQIKKTCNEEVRAIRRICEKVPKITTSISNIVYPNCKRLEVKQGHRSFCSNGSGGFFSRGFNAPGTLLYTDMLEGPTWDDIFLCDRPEDGNECYVGYLVQGRHHSNNVNKNPGYIQGRGIIPKGMQGHMRFMHTYSGSMSGTIFNETKNETVVSGSFTHGQVVALPRSVTEDQCFRFSPSGNVGVVVIYVDRINETKEARVESWSEDCRDI